MNLGYIALHRKMLDNPVVFKDSDHVAVWVYLLLNATHTKVDKLFAGKKVTLQPGQLITGRQKIASTLKVSESKVQRVLKTFEIEQQIEQQTSTKNRLVTVVSWTEYQKNGQQNEQQVNNKRTTSEQQVNTNNNVDNADNGNNEKLKTPAKKLPDKIESDFEEIWEHYPNKKGKTSALKHYRVRLKEGATKEEFLRAVRNYARLVEGKDDSWIKHGSSFFNSKDWRDYLKITTRPEPKPESEMTLEEYQRANRTAF